MRRRLRGLTRSFVWSALAAAVAIFGVALACFLILGTPGRRVVSVLSSTRDAKQERSLVKYLESHGGADCQGIERTVAKDSQYVAGARSIAYVRCNAVGTGADTVGAARFKTADDLSAWDTDNHNYRAGTGTWGTCFPFWGESQWATRDGSGGGTLTCAPGGNGGNTITWSDKRSLTGYFAASASDAMPALLTWWQQHVRGRPTGEDAGLRSIRETFGGAVEGGLDKCRRLRHPLADAVLNCGRSTPTSDSRSYVDALTVFHFRDGRALDSFFKNYERQFHAPSTTAQTFCDKGTLVSSTYDNSGQTAGRIFCFPDGTEHYLLWTLDRRNLAAIIARSDQNARGLYRAWQSLPG
jgi:hypothetical protein